MTDLPSPMTPPDCDLRGYDYMPLFGHHLFSSSFYAECTDAEYRAATRLWWSAWLQSPAASLPTSDNALAVLADYGRDIKGWLKVKGMALHGFVLCSDGRLYHSFLSEEAVRAYALRIKSDTKREADRKRLQEWREARRKAKVKPPGSEDGGGDKPVSETPSETRFTDRVETPVEAAHETSHETQSETGGVAGGKERTLPEEKKKEPPALRASPPQPRGERLPADWTPGDAGWHFATNLGLNPNSVLGKFRDYWSAKPGANGRKLDWEATWRNWCRDDAERRKAKPGAGRSAAEVLGVGQSDWTQHPNLLGIPS